MVSFTFCLLKKHSERSLKKSQYKTALSFILGSFLKRKMRLLIATFMHTLSISQYSCFCPFKNAIIRAVCKLSWRQHVCVVIICRLRILFQLFSLWQIHVILLIHKMGNHRSYLFFTAPLPVTKAIFCSRGISNDQSERENSSAVSNVCKKCIYNFNC